MAKTEKRVVSKGWEALTKEQRVEAVRDAMAQQGTTNKSAAAALGTTSGTVAGIRFKNNIPSTNEPVGAAKTKAATPPLKQPKTPEPGPHVTPLKLAASEATQCNHIFDDNGRCGGEQKPGSRYCAWHQ